MAFVEQKMSESVSASVGKYILKYSLVLNRLIHSNR